MIYLSDEIKGWKDHYMASVFLFCLFDSGGIGEAVAAAVVNEPGLTVQMLAVRKIPRSGPGDKLLELYGISAADIVKAVEA